MPDDYSSTTQTTGTVAVGGSATGEIETSKDFDWFAVDLVAGHTYVIDLEGADSGGGALQDPVLRGLYDADGNRIAGARDNDGGVGRDARLTFTATTTGTYYIEARGHSNQTGDYTVRVTEWVDTDAERGGAADLGDIADLAGPQFPAASIDGSSDSVDYWRFTLSEARRVGLGLRQQDANADLFLEDAEGNVLYSGTEDGTANEWISQTLLAGTYFVRVEAQEEGANEFKLRYGVSAANPAEVAALEQQQEQGTDEAPEFVSGSYGFSLAENADGGTSPVSLGSVSATDPEDSTIIYSIEAGNSDGLFAIDFETGALSYQGAGEDYESGTTSYELTVRAGDGSLHSDVTVTVNVTDVQEAPAFAEGSYAFDLAENADGGTTSVALGAVSATDPEDGTVSYSIEAGDSGGLFAIDSETGALSYHGAGEDYESGTTSYELTVRASDGGLHTDVTVTVNVTDVEEYVILAQEVTETQQSVSEPSGQDLPGGTSTTGAVAVGGSVTGEIEFEGDRDWFAVTLEAGRTYRIDLKGSESGAGTLRDPDLRGVYDDNGVRIAGTTNDDGGAGLNSRVTFTAEDTGTYYVAAGAYRAWKGTYTLSVTDVTDGAPDDFEAGTGTSGAVVVGGPATGEIDYENDRDWFAVTLEAGRSYRIDLEGSETEAGTLQDPHLRGVHDANGVRIARTSNGDGGEGRNSRLDFTAEEDATYYVEAGGNGYSEGTYTLTVTELADDFVAGTGTSGTVAVGGSATGEIDFGGDRDWFAVTLEAGRIYRIDLEASETEAGTLFNPYLRGIHDADGLLIAGTTDHNSGEGLNSRVTFTAEEAGTYYVAAGAWRNMEGAYTLSVTDVTDNDDFVDGTGTSGTVVVGGSATGEIDHGGDRDWFAVTLGAGRTYRINLEGSLTEAGTLFNPYLRGIHDANGVLIAGTTDDNGGYILNSRVTFTAAEAGTYYVAAGAGGNREGTYTLTVTEVADDFVAGTGTSGTVAVGGSAPGEIETVGDHDWFAVTLDAGRTYRIDLEGSETEAGTLVNPYLRGIHDANGVLIAGTTNDNGGYIPNSRVTFTAEEAGTYYVAAGAVGNRVGTYTLSVTDVTEGVPDDFEAGTGTSGTVAVGGSAPGEIETVGDHDWFAVTLDAGRTYRIDLEGSETEAGTLVNPYLRGIHDANGVLIAGTTNDANGEGHNSRVWFTAGEAGTYYVAAGAVGNRVGTYALSVTEVVDDFGAGTRTSGTVAVGGSATGEIDYAHDRDWFAVTLDAGRTYRIDLEGSWTEAGNLGNPYLRGIHDADGVPIAGTTNDNGGIGTNSRVTFTAEEAGTYYVAAGDWGYWEGTYTLSVTDVTEGVPDDFEAGTGTSGMVAAGGSATGEIDYENDRDWFTVTLEAGRTYRIDLEGSLTGAGTLWNPHLRGVHDADGNLIAGTTDDNGGAGYNSRVTFTAADAGTYYVAAGAYAHSEGTYTLSVEEVM